MTFIRSDLKRAFRLEGCSICRLVHLNEERWIWSMLYEFTGDPGLRTRFDEALGLCRYHAHLMVQVVEERELIGMAGVARIYETVVKRYVELLHKANQADILSGVRRSVRRPISDRMSPGPQVCMLCQSTQGGRLTILSLLDALEDEDESWREQFIASDGLCNPHVEMAVEEIRKPELRAFLIEDHLARLEALQERLYQLQRKQSYNVDEEVTPEEARSWREAIWRFTGMEYHRPLIKRGGRNPLWNVE